ncbi:MAG: InlB B-repeat-containing protein, partial [Clostridia bacterium]|nr:InlB B-repeat-containing protein [Clostridia bacterium]
TGVVSAITVPQKTGYTFGGYYTSTGGGTQYINASGSFVNNAYSTVTADTTLYAKWTANTYTVAYNGNGNTGGSTASSSHTYDVAKNLTANGFNRSYTVSYNGNGGTPTLANNTATATFNGWATSAGGAKVYNNSQSVTNLASANGATVDLYANWTLGGVTLPSASKAYDDDYHYPFTGWYDAQSGGSKAGDAGSQYTPTAATTLYAGYSTTAHSYDYSHAVFNWSGYTCANATVSCTSVPSEHHSITKDTVVTSALNDPTYEDDGEWTYTAKFSVGGTEYTSQKTEDVPSLYSLIDLDDAPAVAQGFTAGGVYTFSATTKKSGIGYSLAGLSATAATAHPVAKSSGAITGYNVNTLTLPNASVTIQSGNKIRITPTDMTFSSPIVFYAVVAVTGTQAEKYDTNTVYSYKKITVRPTQLLYYEETEGGMTFVNAIDSNGYGEWTTVGTASTAEIALESAAQAGIGFSSDYSSFATYSGGAAKKVSVASKVNGQWPKVSFSFTGTGFDLISVTDSESGIFVVSVYRRQDGKRVEYRMVDTYYGSTYTPLFYNLHTQRILPNNRKGVDYVVPLYFADETMLANGDIPSEKLVYDGMMNNITYTTDTAYASSAEQAYGWAMTGSDDVLYQIPVISVTDLEYGTYDVTVEARFADTFRHYNTDANGVKYFDLTVDGIRVYEPAKENASVYADGGNLVDFTSIWEEVNSSSSMILLDGGASLDQTQFSNYIGMAPNNEIYLKSGGTAAFEIDAGGCADFRLGMKSADGSSCSVQIAYGNSTKPLTVSTATEMYYSLKDLVGTGEGTLTVTNNGSGILSLTKVMSVTPPSSSSSNAPKRLLAVTPMTLSNARELIEMQNADLTIDAGAIETSASDDGMVTVTLRTGEDAQTIVVRASEGTVIDPDSIEFTVDETGVKNWTVVLSEESSGEYTYTLQAEYENGYAPEEPTTVTVTVTFPEPEPETDTDTESEDSDSSAYDALSFVLSIFMALSDIIRTLIERFG